MARQLSIYFILSLLFTANTLAQEELASDTMKIEVYDPPDIFPISDEKGDVHIFAISENVLADDNIQHIKYGSATGKLTRMSYPKPDNQPTRKAVGISLDSSNTFTIYFHSKGKGKFNTINIDKNGDYEYREFELKTKKEEIVQYMNLDNEFIMLTANRKESVLNLYEFHGNTYSKQSFDLNAERFYSKESKIVPLSDILIANYASIIINELNSKALDFGRIIKIYPSKDKITIALNNNDNGTRIIHLNRNSETATLDYIPMPTNEFAHGAETSIKTNSFIHKDNIYSLIVSNKLLVIDIKSLADKEVLKVFKFDPDQQLSIERTKSTTIPIGPVALVKTNTKERTKSAKAFFRGLKSSIFYGLFIEQYGSEILVKVGGYSPANSTTSAMDSQNVPVGPRGFTKYMLIDGENYELVGEAIYEDIYDKIEMLNAEEYGNQIKALLKFENHYIYGVYNKKNDTYKLVKISP